MTEFLYSHDLVSRVLLDKIDNYYISKTKVVFGPDGSYTDVTLSDPFPVVDSQVHNDLVAFAAQNHADLVSVTGYLNTIDTDLLAFKSANHTDLISVTGYLNTIDTDILSFKSQNHTDLVSVTGYLNTIDTDLLAFKSANHADMVSVTGYLNTIDTHITQFNRLTIDQDQIFCFSIDTFNLASAGTDNPIFVLSNPNGNTKDLYILSVRAGVTITNVAATFDIYANPTVTAAGTSQTIVCRTIGSSATSTATLSTGPTLSSLGTRINSIAQGQNSNAIDFVKDWNIKIKPNNKIVLTGSPSSNNRNAVATIVWAEI